MIYITITSRPEILKTNCNMKNERFEFPGRGGDSPVGYFLIFRYLMIMSTNRRRPVLDIAAFK